MAEEARLVGANGEGFSDLNMRFPTGSATSSSGPGACCGELMKNVDLAISLTEALTKAARLPVTPKISSEWDENSLNSPELIRLDKNAGSGLSTMHGRARRRFYWNRADWLKTGKVKETAKRPFAANDGIASSDQVVRTVRESGAGGIMIDHGARGRPWMPALVAHELPGEPRSKIPTGIHLTKMVRRHDDEIPGFCGIEVGLRTVRKHLGWYMGVAGTCFMLGKPVLISRDCNGATRILPNVPDIASGEAT